MRTGRGPRARGPGWARRRPRAGPRATVGAAPRCPDSPLRPRGAAGARVTAGRVRCGAAARGRKRRQGLGRTRGGLAAPGRARPRRHRPREGRGPGLPCLPEDVVRLHAAVLVAGAHHGHAERRGGHGGAGKSPAPSPRLPNSPGPGRGLAQNGGGKPAAGGAGTCHQGRAAPSRPTAERASGAEATAYRRGEAGRRRP